MMYSGASDTITIDQSKKGMRQFQVADIHTFQYHSSSPSAPFAPRHVTACQPDRSRVSFRGSKKAKSSAPANSSISDHINSTSANEAQPLGRGVSVLFDTRRIPFTSVRRHLLEPLGLEGKIIGKVLQHTGNCTTGAFSILPVLSLSSSCLKELFSLTSRSFSYLNSPTFRFDF